MKKLLISLVIIGAFLFLPMQVRAETMPYLQPTTKTEIIANIEFLQRQLMILLQQLLVLLNASLIQTTETVQVATPETAKIVISPVIETPPPVIPQIEQQTKVQTNASVDITDICGKVMDYPELKNWISLIPNNVYYDIFVSEGVAIPNEGLYDPHPSCDKYLAMNDEDKKIWTDKLDMLREKYNFHISFLMATLIWGW